MDKRACALLALAALAAGCRSASPPPAPGAVYVAGIASDAAPGVPPQGVLQSFDAPTLLPQARLRLAAPVVAAVASGPRLVLALAAPANALVLLDPAHLQRRLRLGLDFTPAALASAPAGRVVVAGQDAAGWGRLALVDVGRARILAEARVGRQPSSLALAPDGSRLLLADSLTRSVSVLDPASLRRLALINLDFPPAQLTSLPYGTQVFALGPDQVAALDWRRGGLLCELPVGARPQAMVLKPDGGELYVSNAGGAVSVIDTSTDVVSATMPAGAGASGLAVAPDGSTLYVANTAAGTVSALDLATRAQLAVVRVGEQPASLVLGAGGGYLFVADRASNDVAVVRSNRDPNNPNTLVTLLPAPARPRALFATAPPAPRPSPVSFP